MLAIAATAIAACSTTPADLEQKTEAVVKNYSENYQEIYRRVSTTAKRCLNENVGPYASMAVDADLYPDLGYGSVTASLINWGVRNYYWTAKIDKSVTGSTLTVRSGNTLASGVVLDKIFKWATGESSC